MRNWKRLTPGILIIALFTFSGANTLYAQQDEIIRVEGRNLTGVKILSESYKEIQYKRGVVDAKISTDKVRDLIYGDRPESYTNGINYLDKEEYENAIDSFKLAMEKKTVREWIQTYGRLQIARAYQGWAVTTPAKYKDAVAAYNDLLQHDPETRFYAEALYNLAKCHAGNGDVAASVQAFDRLAQEAYDKKLGLIWEVRAKFEKAVVQLDGGKLDEADRDFRSAGTFVAEQAKSAKDEVLIGELNRIASLARLYQGTVMIRKKKYADARRFFEEIINDDSSNINAKAGASNGLGEILFTEKNWKEAQFQFARAKVMFADIPEEGAKATYYLGLICLELGEEKEPNCKRKAKQYFTELVDMYPDTDWADKAKAKM